MAAILASEIVCDTTFPPNIFQVQVKRRENPLFLIYFLFKLDSYHQQQQQQTDLRGLYSPINSRPTNPTARAGYSPGQQPVSQQIPGFVNPYAVSQLSPTRAPNRPHFDYQKCGPNLNVQYNPYQSKFNPTLMARPNIEPFQSTAIQTSIANAIARGRTPNLYSSVSNSNSVSRMEFHSGFFSVYRKNSCIKHRIMVSRERPLSGLHHHGCLG